MALKKQNGTASAPPQSRVAAVLGIRARGELVELPELGPAWIAIASHAIGAEVEAEVERIMSERKIPLTGFTVGVWESERAVQTLARCVREAGDHATPLGSPSEWADFDPVAIGKCWTVYGDVVDRLAPLDTELPEAARAEIISALSKKNATALRAFGVNTLSLFLLSMESPPASSPPPTSSGGESSPAS
jgi:hypothetical protein